jgi:hypothetical protein
VITPVRPVGFAGSEADRINGSAAALRRTLLRVLEAGITIYCVLPVPEVGWHVPRTLIKLIAQNRLPLTTSLPTYLQRNRTVLEIARELEGRQGFVPVYPHRTLAVVIPTALRVSIIPIQTISVATVPKCWPPPSPRKSSASAPNDELTGG